MKIAAIDIGSNAIRMAVAKGDNPENLEIILKERFPLRLGTEAFSSDGLFSEKTLNEASEVFKSISEHLKNEKVEKYRAYATSAFRDAKNSEALAKAIEESSGIVIQEMNSDMEAKVILDSILLRMKIKEKRNYLLFDLGGGSLELSKIKLGKISGSISINLGTVRLKNFIEEVDGDENKIKKLFEDKKNELEKFFDNDLIESKKVYVIGTGGNFRSLLKIKNQLFEKKKKSFKRKELSEIKSELERLSFEERIERFNLRPDRSDVILPAIDIIEMVLDFLPVRKVYAPQVGLVNGILEHLVQKN